MTVPSTALQMIFCLRRNVDSQAIKTYSFLIGELSRTTGYTFAALVDPTRGPEPLAEAEQLHDEVTSRDQEQEWAGSLCKLEAYLAKGEAA
jgi:hypothetical protein